MTIHTSHPRINYRKSQGVHTTKKEHRKGFNAWFALLITNAVGTMWCAYVFAILALVSLPAAVQGGTATLVAWTAQTFIQLVLLSIIMVGQKVAAEASDKQALQTYQDAEALLQISDELHRLTKEIHESVINNK